MQTDPISAAKAYQIALRRVLAVQTLHQARQLAANALDITFTPPSESMVSIGSGYGLATKQPFVTFSMANPAETANPTLQVTSDQARDLAFQILEAADAADSDGFLVEFMQQAGQLSENEAGRLLTEFRQWRDQRRQKGGMR